MVIIDLSFRLSGSEIPVDHGYALFSAVSHVIPSLHGEETIGIHPISGLLIGNRLLRITDKSHLVLRMNSERVREAIHLAGKRLDIAGYSLLVGMPSPSILKPATILRSRLVVIKGFLEAEPFLETCRRQLTALPVTGEVSIPVKQTPQSVEQKNRTDTSQMPFIRRTLRIHDKTIVGYAVQVSGLSSEDSIKLQEVGLGGRRRFGCGIFIPYKERLER